MTLVEQPATDTLPKLLARNAMAHPRQPAMRQKDRGIWKTYSWGDCQEHVRAFALGSEGNGHRTLSFGRAEVRRIDLVLSNGSLRLSCPPKDLPESLYSCGGFSRDDNRTYRFRARLGG